jgi:hypothetical protein
VAASTATAGRQNARHLPLPSVISTLIVACDQIGRKFTVRRTALNHIRFDGGAGIKARAFRVEINTAKEWWN